VELQIGWTKENGTRSIHKSLRIVLLGLCPLFYWSRGYGWWRHDQATIGRVLSKRTLFVAVVVVVVLTCIPTLLFFFNCDIRFVFIFCVTLSSHESSWHTHRFVPVNLPQIDHHEKKSGLRRRTRGATTILDFDTGTTIDLHCPDDRHFH
jgi:hypothetical protein